MLSPEDQLLQKKESQLLFISCYIPAIFVMLMSIILFSEWTLNIDLSEFGLLPRTIKGLKGIFFSPLLHADFGHLFSNAAPLLILGAVMIYFYRNTAYKVFGWIWLLDGIGVWTLGRPLIHIGSSGLVYGMAAFVFFSGLLRRNRTLLALSFFVIIAYGGIIWGIYPLENGVSWEAHLYGLLAGIFCSIYYLKKGPPDDAVPEWMNNDVVSESDIIFDAEVIDQEKISDANEIKENE